MEARLTGGSPNILTGRINPKELNTVTFKYYCRLYLIEKIYEYLPDTSPVEYKNVANIINSIDSVLFEDLNTETNVVLLLNQIYSMFRSLANEELPRPFLYEKIKHLASYDPVANTEEKYNV